MGRIWRVGGQGISFVFFGLGAGLLAVTAFPLIALFASGRDLTHKRVRYVIHHGFRLFLWFVQAIGLFKVEVDGAERLANCRGCLIVANHPTLLDIVILMALSPNFQCVVKHQLWRNPFLYGVVSSAGFIRNDLSIEEFLKQCAEAFAAGYNLLVFPEGARTVPGESPKLVRGFANIAILSKVDIQIVIIRCEPVALTRDKPWYAVSKSRSCFRVKVGDLWRANTYGLTPHRAKNARHLAMKLESHYHDLLSDG